MSIILQKIQGHISGKAIQRHSNSAHGGEISADCPACQDLLHKQEKFQNPENWPTPKKISPHIFYDPGRNPTGTCRRSAHYKCSGRHHRNHGLPGEKCTCECHLDLTFQEDYVE